MNIRKWLMKLEWYHTLWLGILVSIFFTEIMVIPLSILFRGSITYDYLISGVIAAFFVSLIVLSIIIYFTEQLRQIERQATERYLNTLESMMEGCQIIDFDWRYIYVNDAVARHGHKTKEELLGHKMVEIYPGIENTEMFAVLRRCMDERVPHRMENEFTYPDGSKGWFELSIQPMPEGIFILSSDITERKKAEESLHTSEEKVRSLIETSTDAVVSINEKREIMLWNNASYRIFGYSRDEVTGKLIDIIVPEKYRERHIEGFNRFLKTGEGKLIGKTLELEGMKKDGGIIPIELSLSTVKTGGAYIFTGIIRDITERKQYEDILKQAKKEWEVTFDSISDPIFIHDREYKIVRANMAYKKAVGVKFKEFIGKPYYEAFPKLAEPHKCCCFKIQNLIKDEEDEIFIPDMNKNFKIMFFPMKYGEEDNYCIHVMLDITESKKAEEKIKTEMEITSHLLMIAEATADTTNLDKMLEEVVHCGHKIIHCDICLSYLWDVGAKVFKPSQSYGLNPDMTPLFKTGFLDMKADIIKTTMEEKKPIIISDDNASLSNLHSAFFNWIPNIKAISLIPLIGKEGYLGLIIGVYNNPVKTEERDIKIMNGIASQVSIALEDARLYRESLNKSMELSQKIETIQVMHDIDRSILSTLKSQEILETVTMMIARLIPCDRATIALVDKERQGFTYAAGFGMEFIQKGAFVSFRDTSISEIIKTGRLQYMPNLKDIKNLPPFEDRLLKEGFLSHIRIPLVAKSEIVGVLSLGSKRQSAFSPEDLSTLEKLAYQIGVALENSRLIMDLEELFLGTVKSLSSAIDAKSKWTAGHSERVTRYAVSMGKEMSFSEKELKDLELAGLLHDVGKIGTYEAILDKAGKLTDEEFNLIKQHPVKGADILSQIKQMRGIIPGVRHHHEFYNGKGYPDGLKGDEIHLMARIMCVADSVDAMGADRPYRKGKPMDEIIIELKRCSGTQFDPKVVEVFLKVV